MTSLTAKWATLATAMLVLACEARRPTSESAARPSPLLAAGKPNIIFILADDLGYGDLGSFWQDRGSRSAKKFDTPQLDRLAAEGMKLTHHYVGAPVCAPSRASLLTGRHQGHADVRDNWFDKALPRNHTLGTVLQAAGYTTAWIGKAGLAGEASSVVDLTGDGSKNLAAHPLYRGFDRFFGYLFHGDAHAHYPRNGAFLYDGFNQIANASVDFTRPTRGLRRRRSS
jgi:arylsulfatase A-like enzyme